MKMKITGDEPINPSIEDGWTRTDLRGLTIRQHFAAMAMQGLLSGRITGANIAHSIYADAAVKYTDALIIELNKKDEKGND